MKKNIVIAVIFAMVMGMTTVNAAEIPTESLPFYVNDESVIIAESHISDILDEVKNGLGYADAVNKANSRILNAVLNNETNGYGYGVLADITRNAVFQYREMYLRPEFYRNAEEWLKPLLTDIIAEYANGTTDKNTAIKKAYEKIYQTADRSFDYDAQLELDTCYRDIPSVCGSYFTVARKLILNAK